MNSKSGAVVTALNQQLPMDRLADYTSFIKRNQHFRRLWISQMVSNFGDWFGLLAVYALFTQYSDSALLLGLVIIVKMLSLGTFSPIAGYLTDRFNRRRLMIWCDLIRAVIVAGFMLIRSQELLWLAYPLMGLQMMLSAIYEPAKSSSIPNITTEEELVKANVLSALSWSIIFTSGMGLGGLATAYFGTDAVFILDVISYLISAWFVFRAVIPQQTEEVEEAFNLREPITRIAQGVSYLRDNREVLRPALAKASLTICLGALVYLLILISEKVLMLGSVGVGLLYASRGLGTAVGPIIGKRIFSQEKNWIKAMGIWMIGVGAMYFIVGLMESLALMLLFVFFAHAASGANWVMSTVLLQRRAPDYVRGRVFSFEWLMFTFAQSISVFIASNLLELEILTVNGTMLLFASLLVGIGILWSVTVRAREREYQNRLVVEAG